MNDWQRVVNYIPKGKENAITRAALTALTGYPDRTNRQAIEEARRNGVKIVSRSSGKGYYIADNDDDWLLFLEEHRRRAMAALTVYNNGIKYLDSKYLASRIIPVRAHVRHLKADMPCDGQMSLEV